jgi:hypothetical protein
MRTYVLCMAVLTILAVGVGCDQIGEPSAFVQEVPTATPAPEDITVAEAAPAGASDVSTTTEMMATLTVQQGLVEMRRVGQTSYATVTGTELVGDGDMIRTGDDGIALLTFLDNTETTIFESTEMVINSFAMSDEDKFAIKLQQITGLTFNRINFTNKDSLHQISTPYGVAAVRGTGYWVDLRIREGFVTFAVVAGVVDITFTDGSGQQKTSTLRAGQVEGGGLGQPQTLQINAGGEVTEGELELYCGDGICDVYTGEDSSTCPDDCG